MENHFNKKDSVLIPSVYAIVLNWNGYEDTVKCIESLKRATYTNLQIILIDNASTDGSYEKLKDDYKNIFTIHSDKNGGYASGMNLGIRESLKKGAQFILLVNNDIIVEQNFLEPMIKLALQNEKVGLISPRVLYQHDQKLVYSAGGKIDLIRCAGVCEYQGYSVFRVKDNKRKISLAEGCFILVRSEVFNKIGFLSEQYFMYFEDVDFSERVSQMYELYYLPESVVFHKSGAGTSWEKYSDTYNYFFTRNRLFHFRNKSLLYRIYVIIFSISVSVAKSTKISIRWLSKKITLMKMFNSLKSLWSGVWDGLLLILHIRNS